jgi:hypothetical protein
MNVFEGDKDLTLYLKIFTLQNCFFGWYAYLCKLEINFFN